MKRWILLCGVILAAVAHADTPPPQSNTVPTSQLDAEFAVDLVQGQPQVQLDADLAQVTSDSSGKHYQELAISTDDTVTFSVCGVSMKYGTDADSNILPYVPGAIYSVTFKRATGEVFTSQTQLTQPVTVSSPAQNASFKKTDAVTIEWNSVQADLPGPIMALYTFDCDTSEDFTFNGISATIPAGFASSCAGAVYTIFGVIYGNAGIPFSDLSGSFSTDSMGVANFSYDGNATDHESPSYQKLIKFFTQARRKRLTS